MPESGAARRTALEGAARPRARGSTPSRSGTSKGRTQPDRRSTSTAAAACVGHRRESAPTGLSRESTPTCFDPTDANREKPRQREISADREDGSDEQIFGAKQQGLHGQAD